MAFWVVIPARYGSTRLPGKALLDIAGKPMLQHVYECALKSAAERVIIATDDERIEAAATDFGGEVVMTSTEHASGTDRLYEVASNFRLPEHAMIVNVQGDEPMMPPELINQVAEKLIASPRAGVATLCEPIVANEDVFDPNVVKVVRDLDDKALYFSRAPIPWYRDWVSSKELNNKENTSKAAVALQSGDVKCWRHIGIYAYRVGFLARFVQWPKAELETIESLEQLRALQHGVEISVATADCSFPGGVDTEQDLQRIRNIMFERQSH